jgi:hypothetical protein
MIDCKFRYLLAMLTLVSSSAFAGKLDELLEQREPAKVEKTQRIERDSDAARLVLNINALMSLK